MTERVEEPELVTSVLIAGRDVTGVEDATTTEVVDTTAGVDAPADVGVTIPLISE